MQEGQITYYQSTVTAHVMIMAVVVFKHWENDLQHMPSHLPRCAMFVLEKVEISIWNWLLKYTICALFKMPNSNVSPPPLIPKTGAINLWEPPLNNMFGLKVLILCTHVQLHPFYMNSRLATVYVFTDKVFFLSMLKGSAIVYTSHCALLRDTTKKESFGCVTTHVVLVDHSCSFSTSPYLW